MVSNVEKLTRSVREGFMKNASEKRNSPSILAEKRAAVHRELSETGKSIFVDEHGNRFRIERKPA